MEFKLDDADDDMEYSDEEFLPPHGRQMLWIDWDFIADPNRLTPNERVFYD